MKFGVRLTPRAVARMVHATMSPRFGEMMRKRNGRHLAFVVVLALGVLGAGPPGNTAGGPGKGQGPPAAGGPNPACGQIVDLSATEVDGDGDVEVTVELADDACGSVLYELAFGEDGAFVPADEVRGGDEHGTTITFVATVPDGATEAQVTTTFGPPGKAKSNPHAGRELDRSTTALAFAFDPDACEVGGAVPDGGDEVREVHGWFGVAFDDEGSLERISLHLLLDHAACQGASFGWVHFADRADFGATDDPSGILTHSAVTHSEFRPVDGDHPDVTLVERDLPGDQVTFEHDDVADLIGGCVVALVKATGTDEAFFVSMRQDGGIFCQSLEPPDPDGPPGAVSPFF